MAGDADPAAEAAAEELWARIKADHETGQYTQIALSRKYGVPLSKLKYRIYREAWTRRYRSRAVDRPMIVARLFNVLEQQVRNLELEMNDMAKAKGRSGEREVTLLGKLAGNLDRLMELDARSGAKSGQPQRSRQMQDIRDRLAKRIEHLKHG